MKIRTYDNTSFLNNTSWKPFFHNYI